MTVDHQIRKAILAQNANNADTMPVKEFEEFCYIISHDMQASLRHIREFSKLLLNDLGQPLTQQQQVYSDFLQKGVHTSEEMINALLSYSRLSTCAMPMTTVDSEVVLVRAIDELQSKILHRSAQIFIESMPHVYADQSQLRQLFIELIDNALKFQDGINNPQITISGSQDESFCHFKVHDNGIGFPDLDTSAAFKMFRTFHASDGYEGVGAGLAICKKIVQSHGGLIWIENNILGQGGSTLNFSLATVSQGC